MRIRDWSSDVCSSDLAARIWPAPVSKSSNLSPDRSSVALRLSEIVRIAMRTGLNGRLSSIGMAEAARVGQPDAILAVGKARPFALRERGAADRWLTLLRLVHPVVAEQIGRASGRERVCQ